MSAGCMRLLLRRTVRAVCDVSPAHCTSASRLPTCGERSDTAAFSGGWSPFSTAAGGTEQTPAAKKKKQGSGAPDTIGAFGRNIRQRLIDVISDTDEYLGPMHRADVIKMMDRKGLKLVLLNKHKDPPVYKLMSGKQIHEEQMKLREKQKAKAAPVQEKALVFSSAIAAHDLSTKLKKAEAWLEKKHHVKITLQCRGGRPEDNLDKTLEQIVQQMGLMVGFVTKPRVLHGGKAAVCVLRPDPAGQPSKERENEAAASQSADKSSTAAPKRSVSKTDTTGGSGVTSDKDVAPKSV